MSFEILCGTMTYFVIKLSIIVFFLFYRNLFYCLFYCNLSSFLFYRNLFYPYYFYDNHSSLLLYHDFPAFYFRLY